MEQLDKKGKKRKKNHLNEVHLLTHTTLFLQGSIAAADKFCEHSSVDQFPGHEDEALPARQAVSTARRGSTSQTSREYSKTRLYQPDKTWVQQDEALPAKSLAISIFIFTSRHQHLASSLNMIF